MQRGCFAKEHAPKLSRRNTFLALEHEFYPGRQKSRITAARFNAGLTGHQKAETNSLMEIATYGRLRLLYSKSDKAVRARNQGIRRIMARVVATAPWLADIDRARRRVWCHLALDRTCSCASQI
jgi:hypothetical protein